MVERVSKWHQMLRPVLANCEKRNNFDIHALGSDIMNLFPAEETAANSSEISFNDVMANRDQTYTARYFLSLLLLTNNKNVQLKKVYPEQNGKIVCSKDDIKIILNSRKRHLDEVNKIDQHIKETNVGESSQQPIVMDHSDMTSGNKKKSQKRKWTKS